METPCRRRLFQFSIKSMLLVTLLVATFSSGWIAHREVARKKTAEDRIRAMNRARNEKRRSDAELTALLNEVVTLIRADQAEWARRYEEKVTLRMKND